jgi:ABC-2 type transport system ATP-binding protein
LQLKLVTADTDRALQGLESVGIKAVADGAVLSALIPSGQIEPERIVQVLVELGVRVKAFELAAPTLEDRFVLLTGEGFDVAR